ncbi:RNA polymerase sigma factor [Hydrocarboniphaga sp.]|uniref:RNA polymerase sigma factor n=1 Tax=Hydrocarboniphaga sp. TaxID=2033016 RepID=UPI003D0CE71B
MQDAYLRLLSRSAALPELRSPKAFLFTVASNLSVDRVRSQQRMRRLLAEQHQFEVTVDGDELHRVCPLRAGDDQVDAELRLRDVVT